jgi:hypothetical protein
MKSNSVTTQFLRFCLAATTVCLSGIVIIGQTKSEYKAKNKDFCSSYNYSNGDKVSFRETRETTVSAGSLVNVDGKRNGGIHVKGENRSDVLIRACIQTVGATDEEARAIAKNIRIETGSTIHAEGAGDESNWAVSYEILVPRSTNLKLAAHNGGISISSVEGSVDFETTNGGVNLSDVAGDVKGKTTNGGVNVALSGGGWKGGGLDVQTTNGGVRLSIPETYAAHVETGTVNGGFRSDIGALNAERDERNRPVKINTDLNGGGATVRVVTTNGGIQIVSSTSKTQ